MFKRQSLRSAYNTSGGKAGRIDIKEMDVLKDLVHRNIVKLHEIIDDPNTKKIYAVMDYYSGGNLQQKILETENGCSDVEARYYFSQLISAIHYCHEVKNCAHRDIKPENILLNELGQSFLCDFGMSQLFTANNDILKGPTDGTVRFMAPEMHGLCSKPVLYGRSIDIWAAGVSLYYMMTKKYPFDGKSRETIRE